VWDNCCICWFVIGYFVYDLFDLIVNKQALKQWELIPHHISVWGCILQNFCAMQLLVVYCIFTYYEIFLYRKTSSIFKIVGDCCWKLLRWLQALRCTSHISSAPSFTGPAGSGLRKQEMSTCPMIRQDQGGLDLCLLQCWIMRITKCFTLHGRRCNCHFSTLI